MASEKLTRDLIRTLQVAGRPYEIRDTELRGLLLRVNPSGRMVYVVQYDRGKRVTVGRADVMPPSEARAKARQVLGDYERGIDLQAERRKKLNSESVPTLSDFLRGQYKEFADAHYRDPGGTLNRLRSAFPSMLDKRLDQITAWDVEKWRAARLKGKRTEATVNRELNSLKACLKRAAEWGVIAINPLAGAVKLRKVDSQPKTRFLTDAEEHRLRDALDAREDRIRSQRASANQWRSERGYALLPSLEEGYADHLKPVVLLSLNTGMRRGEVFNLQWDDVDLGMKILTVRGEGAKSGESRHIPLNQEAYNVLEGWGRTHTQEGYVFAGEDGGRLTSVRSSWDKSLKDAKVTGFRWHDLRHTFASRLVMSGVDLNTVRELLGHADLKMTIRYAHLAPHVKADAVSRLDKRTLTGTDQDAVQTA